MTTTFDPDKPISLTNTVEAYFEMRIDPTSPYAELVSEYVLRTNDPETSDHVFVDGKRLQNGSAPQLAEFVPCNETAEVDWEDGGDFGVQDFGFNVTGVCTVSAASPLRLTE